MYNKVIDTNNNLIKEKIKIYDLFDYQHHPACYKVEEAT